MISDNDCHDTHDDDAVDVLSMMMFRSMLHGGVVVGVVVWMERWSDGRYEGGLTEIIQPLTMVREQLPASKNPNQLFGLQKSVCRCFFDECMHLRGVYVVHLRSIGFQS